MGKDQLSRLHVSITLLSDEELAVDDVTLRFCEEGRTLKGAENCCVCLEPMCTGDMLRRLPCFHHMHAGCAMSVLPRTGCCPLCRCSIVGGGLGVPDQLQEQGTSHSTSSPGTRRRDTNSRPPPRDAPRQARRTNSAHEIHELHEVLPVSTVRQSPRHIQEAGHYPGGRVNARQTRTTIGHSRQVGQETEVPRHHGGTSSPNSRQVPESSVPLPPIWAESPSSRRGSPQSRQELVQRESPSSRRGSPQF